ncbi:MAG TPA: polysaccharide biosynthesis/export family protein [Vicinamibacterales bacterium]|nr:polysaccharide biosynthesis/export family protein [Vicinamibacterales bacterium]
MAFDDMRQVAVAAVAVLVLGVTPGAHQAPASSAPPKVSAGDQLDVRVWGVDLYTGRYPVAPDGTLDFPDLGTVKVAGLTTREIEADLARRLKDGGYFLQAPQITVALEQAENQRVTVSGAVAAPSVIQFAGELTVFEAIVRAGQATTAASDEVLIIRAPGASGNGSPDPVDPALPAFLTVDLKALRNGDMTNNLRLHDGDTVIVREAQDFFIYGEVRSPGSFPARAGLTIEQALALAGGLTERGSTRRIEIKRVGLDEPLKGVKLDDLVKPGDTIKVNRSIM